MLFYSIHNLLTNYNINFKFVVIFSKMEIEMRTRNKYFYISKRLDLALKDLKSVHKVFSEDSFIYKPWMQLEIFWEYSKAVCNPKLLLKTDARINQVEDKKYINIIPANLAK